MKKVVVATLVACVTSLFADGAAIYKSKCASCHGQKGEMKALGKSAPLKGLKAADVEKSLKGYKAGTLNKNGMGGVMKGQAAGLSDANIKDLAKFIETL
ncbi:MAG: c-type cytochrome [Campylobacterales bacterium]